MTTIAEVLDGLEATLTHPDDGIEGLSFYRVASGPVSTPAVVLGGITVEPNADMDGSSVFKVDLTVVVDDRSDDDISDLLALLEPTSPLSIPSVLEAAPTLGDVVGDLLVKKVDSLREITTGGSAYWGGSLSLELLGLGEDD